MMGKLASLRTVLVLVLALSLAGCSNSLLGPTGGNEPGGNEPSGNETPTEPLTSPEILVIDDAQPLQPVRYTRLTAEPVEVEPVGSRALHVSAVIDGTVGGQVQCGRFLLSIPAGAFEGEGTISMSMPDSTVMVVDIEIEPAGLNNFNEQVKLCLLTDGTQLDEQDLQIYWWDPDKTEWKALGCDQDLSSVAGATEGILTHLSHFSRYSGGKAGW